MGTERKAASAPLKPTQLIQHTNTHTHTYEALATQTSAC